MPWPPSAPAAPRVHLLDNVRVDYYGTPTPVNQVANLHVPEPGMITITPWDASQIGPIEKAHPHRRSRREPFE